MHTAHIYVCVCIYCFVMPVTSSEFRLHQIYIAFCALFQGTQRSKKQSPFAGSPVRTRPKENILSKEESNVAIGNNIKFF